MSHDRRQQPRYILRTTARIPLGDGQVSQETTTVNVSVGGICVELDRALPGGAPLSLELMLSDGDSLHLQGTVRHATRVGTSVPGASEQENAFYLVGVAFSALEPPQRAALEQLIRELEEEPA